MALTHLALGLILLVPQGGESGSGLTSVLSKAEQEKLNKSAKKWFEAEEKLDAESINAKRAKLRKTRDRARATFMKEWDGKAAKEPLKHPGDLLAVFENVFDYPRQSGTGLPKSVSSKGGPEFTAVVPKGYRAEIRYPCIVSIPGQIDGKWADGKEHFNATWKGTDLHNDGLFIIPLLSDGLELDPLPDMSTDQGDAQERANIEAVLRPVGDASFLYRTDRNRWILDCGEGSSGFGLRLATHFPTRFAGLILRAPVDPGKLRLDSLIGIPVLVVSDTDTAAAADKVAKSLNDLQGGSCKLVKAQGAYPYAEMAAEISKWAAGVERNMFRKKVVIAPNQDRWLRSYWLEITKAESVYAAADAQPFLMAEADRDTNTIKITARNVSSFRVLLNDALIDLDKDFSLVVNGKVLTEKRQRSFLKLRDLIQLKRDPNFVFTTDYMTNVPKAENSPGGEK